MSVNEGKMFQCSICKEKFNSKISLESHSAKENITFIPPKPKIAKVNKVVNPIDPNEVPNSGTFVDRGTPNEGVGNPETISSGMHQF